MEVKQARAAWQLVRWEGEVGAGAPGVGQSQSEHRLHMHLDFIAIKAAVTYSGLFQGKSYYFNQLEYEMHLFLSIVAVL
jgi:hypothetical protein